MKILIDAITEALSELYEGGYNNSTHSKVERAMSILKRARDSSEDTDTQIDIVEDITDIIRVGRPGGDGPPSLSQDAARLILGYLYKSDRIEVHGCEYCGEPGCHYDCDESQAGGFSSD